MLGQSEQLSNAGRIASDLLNRNATPHRTTNVQNKRKVSNPMTPTPKYSPVTRTVFDLSTFDDVKLTKEFVPPAEPKTLQEALEAVQNDQSKLLQLIFKGLVSEARDAQYNDLTGFKSINDDGEVSAEPYNGKFADESQGKMINAAVLTMAKVLAGGAWDSKNKDEKNALKEQAKGFIRSNPAILQSFGQAPAAPTV